MKVDYDSQAFDPPAPVLAVNLSHPITRGPVSNFLAQIDTGADVTVIPAETVNRLGLEQTGELIVAGYDDQPARVPICAVWIALSTGRQIRLNVFPMDQDRVLLGRDALNSLRLLLDGPALTVEVLPAEGE